MEKLASNLRKCMEARGLTADSVAKETGIPGSTLHRILCGSELKAGHLLCLARYFGVSMEWLLLGDESRPRSDLFMNESGVEYSVRRNSELQSLLEKAEELKATARRIIEGGPER